MATTELIVTVSESSVDYVRNFMVRHGMFTALNAFQNEWYAGVATGAIAADEDRVPDALAQNKILKVQLETCAADAAVATSAMRAAAVEQSQLAKERDFHRLSHRRLTKEVTTLKAHVVQLESCVADQAAKLENQKQMYTQAASKKMVAQLERDHAVSEMSTLRATLRPTATATLASPAPHAPLSPRPPSASALAPISAGNASHPPAPPPVVAPLSVAAAATLKVARSIEAHGGPPVSALRLHALQRRLATVGDDRAVRVWEAGSGTLLWAQTEAHSAWLSACDWHPAGTHLATGAGDGTVKLWDVSKSPSPSHIGGKPEVTLAEHSHAVWGLAFHPAQPWLVSASMDSTLKVWDCTTAACRATLRAHTLAVNAVAFQDFSHVCVSGGADAQVLLWDARLAQPAGRLLLTAGAVHTNAVNCVAFSQSGAQVYSGDADGTLAAWDMRTLRPVAVLATAAATATATGPGCRALNGIAPAPGGEVLLAASNDSTLHVVDICSFQITSQLTGHSDSVLGVQADPYARHVYSCSDDGTVRIWG